MPGAKHRPSLGLPGAAEQPQPCTLPCLHKSPAAALEAVVGISSSSTSCWKWASSSSSGHWEASLPTPGLPAAAGWQAQPRPSLWLCLLLQPGRPDLALLLAPGFRGQQNAILMVLLRNPRVTFHVPSHKLLRQNVQGRNKSCLYSCFLLKKLAGN